MPTNIVSHTIDSIIDKQMTLETSQFAAIMDIGTDWTKLRIGGRIGIEDTGASITGTPRFCFGVMSTPNAGLVNGPLNSTTNHFCGLRSDAATWTRQTGPVRYYFSCNNYCQVKVDATVVSGTSASVLQYLSPDPTTYRLGLMVEIEKINSTTTRIGHCIQNASAGTESDLSEADFRMAMEIPGLTNADDYMNAKTSSTYYGIGTVDLATDEAADGEWDSITIGFDKTPVMHISELLYTKFE